MDLADVLCFVAAGKPGFAVVCADARGGEFVDCVGVVEEEDFYQGLILAGEMSFFSKMTFLFASDKCVATNVGKVQNPADVFFQVFDIFDA